MFALLMALLMATPSPDAISVQYGAGVSGAGFLAKFTLDRKDIGFQISEALYPNRDHSVNFLHRIDFRKGITGADYSYLFAGLALNEVKGDNPSTGLGISGGGGCMLFPHCDFEIGLTYEVAGEFGGTYHYVCDRNPSPDRSSFERSKYGVIAEIFFYF